MFDTFGYDYVKEQIEESFNTIKNPEEHRHHAVATMRIERFYSNLKEESSRLVDKATSFLDKQNYVGFFKICGPNYVRGIRRAQEVTTVFSYVSSSLELAQEFATMLDTSNMFGATTGHNRFTKAKFDPIISSLEIKILAFGLDLDEQRTNPLVLAPTLDDYNRVVKSAFRVMTQNVGGNRENIGQVYGIEVTPWVDNMNFQIASRLDDESIEIRNLDKATLKNNMAANAEFVARLDTAVQSRFNQITTLERCVSAAKIIPSSKYGNHILKPHGGYKFDKAMEDQITLDDLKTYLDPLGDYSFVSHMGKEFDEWLDMYYQPCLGVISNKNGHVSSDAKVASSFMAYPWHTYTECAKLSCLSDSMRWDREGATCSDSLIAGSRTPSFNTTSDAYCSYRNSDGSIAKQECKYTTHGLAEYQVDVNAKWNSLPTAGGRVDYMMEQFCMPVVTDKERVI
jgi:hypothetical protein